MASTSDSKNGHNNIDISGHCYVCKVLCTNRCSNCSEWYCSLKCQRTDWYDHHHAYVCFTMPNLTMGPSVKNVKYVKNNIDLAKYESDEESTTDHNGSLEKIPSQKSSRTKRRLRHVQPKPDDYVTLTRVEPNAGCIRKWYSDNYISNTHRKDYTTNMREVSEKLLEWKRKTQCSEIDAILHGPTTSKTVQVSIHPEPSKTLESTCELKAFLAPTTQFVNQQSAATTFIHHLTLETLSDDVADVLILDTSGIAFGLISVIALENLGKLVMLQTRIEKVVNDEAYNLVKDAYNPQEKELCLVKFKVDHHWYRAEYIGNGNFRFIDRCILTSVERGNVRKLPLSLGDPCYIQLCRIQNFKMPSIELTESLRDLLDKNLVHKGCKVSRVRVKNEFGVEESEMYITLQLIENYIKNELVDLYPIDDTDVL